MCLIVFAYQLHPDFPLILAANRDEFRDRPTRPAQFWPEQPNVLGGRDLAQGGSWLGLSRQGRLATVTNYRDPKAPTGSRSRGALVNEFLREPATPAPAFFSHLQSTAGDYSGFNLVAGDLDALYYYSNQLPPNQPPRQLGPGLYGLSNHLLDTAWPKVERAKAGLRALLDQPQPSPDALLALLQDSTPAPDAQLPDTGVGLAWERRLSPIFIPGEHYGTRASTLILWSRWGEVRFIEQNFQATGPEARHDYQLQVIS